MTPMLRATAISAFSCACFNSPEAVADTRFTYTSKPLAWESTQHDVPDDLLEKKYAGPVFSVSFTMPWEVSSLLSPQTFFMPTPEVASSENYVRFIVNPMQPNVFTVAPGGAVTDWDFSYFMSPVFLPSDGFLAPFENWRTYIYSTPDNDRLEVRYNLTTYPPREPPYIIGSVEINYNNAALPGDWTVAAVSAVPEPETYTMMLGGLALTGWLARRRNKSRRTTAA